MEHDREADTEDRRPIEQRPQVTDSRAEPTALLTALGGRRGIADTGLPGLAFVIAYTASGQELNTAILAAVAVGAALFVARLAKQETIQFALAGFIGVALAAFIASKTGRAEDFFLPGLFLNLGYAAAFLISIAMRWPLLGVLVGPLQGEGMEWRMNERRLKLYTRASWIWVAMFSLRLAVQLPLYFAGELVALGAAKTAMGAPIFALAAWVSYLILREGPAPAKERVA